MRNILKTAALVCAIVGMNSMAYAQNAQCVGILSDGKPAFSMKNGDILKFVAENDMFMRNVKAQGVPQLAGKVASTQLAPGCTAVIYGGGGAKWGHKLVKASGSLGVPASEVYGFKCECK